MKLRILTWIHDRKWRRWRYWPVLRLVRAYAVGYVEGRRHGKNELPGVFGARRGGGIGGPVPRAYDRGRAAGARERRARSELRPVA